MALRLTVKTTANIVESYATLTRSESLLPLVRVISAAPAHAATTPIVDMVRFSGTAGCSGANRPQLRRPLTPRLYSVASSQAETETKSTSPLAWFVIALKGRARAGGASASSPTAWKKGEMRVFIEHNDNFHACQLTRRRRSYRAAQHRAVPPLCQQRAAEGRKAELAVLRQRTLPKISSIRWQRYVKRVVKRIDLAGHAIKRKKFTYKTSCVNRVPSCGAGSILARIFMSAAVGLWPQMSSIAGSDRNSAVWTSNRQMNIQSELRVGIDYQRR